MRQQTLKEFLSQKENDKKMFVESTMDPLLQKNLENYLNSLKNKKNK